MASKPSVESPKRVAIVGPTAVGKTAVAVALAERTGAEIVSADSMQVYRRMDVGSAKPTTRERARAPFHLIDIVDPDQDWTLADYQARAGAALDDIEARGKPALIVGGTGLYVRAVTTRLDIPTAPPDPDVRAKWQAVAEREGVPAVHARLAQIDPEAAARIHVNDLVRIVRGLEVYETLGVTLSELHARNRDAQAAASTDDSVAIIGLNYEDRRKLYAQIERRVDTMIGDGLLDEVRGLIGHGYGPELRPMQSLGYRHMCEYLSGTHPWPDVVDRMKRDTRHYARRQLIWFRGDPRVHWVNLDRTVRDADELADVLLAILSRDSRQSEDTVE